MLGSRRQLAGSASYGPAILLLHATAAQGVVAERPEAEEMALEGFGRDLGVAFQLVDDVLDYAAEQAALGKTVGDDFREGKVTLPVILAYRAGDDSERAFWKRTIGDLDQRDDDLPEAQRLMARHGTLETSLDRARDYANAAHAALRRFPANPHRAALAELVDFCVERAY